MTDGTQPVHAAPPTAEDPGHFRDLFEQHLHPMFVEDWSRLKQFLDNLQAVGVTDFVAYFADHPQDFARIPHLIVWQHVNRAGCGMFGVASVPELVHYMRTDPKQNFQSSGTCFQALMNGQVAVQIESEDFNLNGDRLTLAETFGLADGFEKTWARIYIGVNDITDLRTTEAALRNQKKSPAAFAGRDLAPRCSRKRAQSGICHTRRTARRLGRDAGWCENHQDCRG